MGKITPTKLFFFFIFFASAISAIADGKVWRRDADPCESDPWKYVKAEVGKVEGQCDESDMASFTNSVACTRDFLLDHKPYQAADFVFEFHRQNAGRSGFLVEALLHKLDILNPAFVEKCTSKNDREAVMKDYHRGLNVMLEELEESGIFSIMNIYADQDYDEDYTDNDNDDIEVNFFDR